MRKVWIWDEGTTVKGNTLGGGQNQEWKRKEKRLLESAGGEQAGRVPWWAEDTNFSSERQRESNGNSSGWQTRGSLLE